jgi:hypothetical protein
MRLMQASAASKEMEMRCMFIGDSGMEA